MSLPDTVGNQLHLLFDAWIAQLLYKNPGRLSQEVRPAQRAHWSGSWALVGALAIRMAEQLHRVWRGDGKNTKTGPTVVSLVWNLRHPRRHAGGVRFHGCGATGWHSVGDFPVVRVCLFNVSTKTRINFTSLHDLALLAERTEWRRDEAIKEPKKTSASPLNDKSGVTLCSLFRI